MDRICFQQYLQGPKPITALPDVRLGILFADNASGHNVNDAIQNSLNVVNTVLRILPPNFVINIFIYVWNAACDTESESYRTKQLQASVGKYKPPVSSLLFDPW